MREHSTYRNSQKHFIPKRKHFLSPTITTHQGLSGDTVATYFESKPGIFSDKVFESGVSPTLVNSEISRRGWGREITSDFTLPGKDCSSGTCTTGSRSSVLSLLPSDNYKLIK
ncbi:hypothetical protein TNCV_4611961 [Trichonephila clavipes]|nr:hypothetical protein TNCV_4611961 [Trichonephila clavipes]